MTPCREFQGARANGYGQVTRGGRVVFLHRWIVEQVEGPLLAGEIVRHRCDNPPCFRYSHLLRGSYADNTADMMMRGRNRVFVGEAHGMARLSSADICSIRQRHVRRSAGERGNRAALAAEFGIHPVYVDQIIRRQVWRHL